MSPKKTPESADGASSSDSPMPEAAPVAVEATPAPAAAEVPKEPKATPAEWAQKLGHAFAARAGIPQSKPRVSPEHAAADALYGWSQHAYNFQRADQRFEITEANYRKALETAGQFPTVAPHGPALPPSKVEQFKNFEPRAARAKGRS